MELCRQLANKTLRLIDISGDLFCRLSAGRQRQNQAGRRNRALAFRKWMCPAAVAKGRSRGIRKVSDDATLAIPDRRGNRRVDTCCRSRHRLDLLCSGSTRNASRYPSGHYCPGSEYQARDGGPWPGTRSRDNRRR